MGQAKRQRDRVAELERAQDRLVEAAVQRGKDMALREIIDFLEERLMNPKVKLGSVQAAAIQAVAGEVVARFKPELMRLRNGELDPEEVAQRLKN